MASYKIPTDQLAKYKKSVHWKMMTSKGDLSAPTCNDCHGNHGAAPPGISWVGNVCGQCHPVNAELFNKSRHGQLFVQMGIPGCATCHSNHEIRKPAMRCSVSVIKPSVEIAIRRRIRVANGGRHAGNDRKAQDRLRARMRSWRRRKMPAWKSANLSLS